MKLNEKNYIERDVSWMYFNRRILDEAQRHDIQKIMSLLMLLPFILQISFKILAISEIML